MLERHTELIKRLLRDSLTRTSEFNQGWSFTNDGTLYFSVWDENENTGPVRKLLTVCLCGRCPGRLV